MAPEKPRRLGRGLEALLAARPGGDVPGAPAAEPSALRTIPIAQIRPNPYQPRLEFKAEDLADLEASLRANGLLQPITVRPAGQGFELIAGERRYRAATRIGWTEIPAIVKEIDDQTALTLALVENLQRSDLNSVEEAEGYQRLIADFALTQQQVADLVGKDRTTVTNALRILALPAAVRRMIQDGQLTQGHARALLSLGSERAIADLAREIASDGLSVRDVERRVRETTEKKARATKAKPESPERAFKTAEVRRIEDRLRRHFQTDVQIALSDKQKGEIRIAFYSPDDFERVLDALGARVE